MSLKAWRRVKEWKLKRMSGRRRVPLRVRVAVMMIQMLKMQVRSHRCCCQPRSNWRSPLTRPGPTTGETKYGVLEEVKPAGDMGTEDMEVTLSEAALTAGNLTPMSSQDAVIIYAPGHEVKSLK